MTSVTIFDIQCVLPQPNVYVLLKRSSLGAGEKKRSNLTLRHRPVQSLVPRPGFDAADLENHPPTHMSLTL